MARTRLARAVLKGVVERASDGRRVREGPYRPRTNGKAERFIRTLLERGAYGAIYGSSTERTAALPTWIDFYNHRRPHGSRGHRDDARDW